MSLAQLSRRDFLWTVPAFVAASRAMAQTARPIPVRKLNHVTLNVSDVKRSLDFYQGLFGMPIQARQGQTVCLRIGSGPQYLALSPANGDPPSISHFSLTVPNFNVDRLIGLLEQHGIMRIDGPGDGSLSGGPLRVRVRMRGPDEGGAAQGTPELYFGDPDGLVIQLQDPSYCGGAGPLGNVCGTPEPAPQKGLLELRGLSHFTVFTSSADRSNAFHQQLFGWSVQARQGPASPLLGVGDKIQFVMFGGGARGARGGGAARARIDHACFNMEGFNTEVILKTLEGYGIKPREGAAGRPGPLVSYVSLRMENRGGAPEGTPELYFTDPDGLLIQLQDVTYCGGRGYLGDICG